MKTIEELKARIVEVAESYHARMCGPSFYSEQSRLCGCCGGNAKSLSCIEHDSEDYSKDLLVCGDCYSDILNYWQDKKYKKTPY